jgi:phage shock protein A
MNVVTRFFRYLKGLINGNLDKWENPEIIINEAVREMKENQIKNRELAVQAITQKNNLQQAVDSEERLVAEYERKATLAVSGGNRELAKQFLKEKAIHQQTLESMRASLASAIEAAEKVKIAIKNEEDRIRVRTSEALALKANMKQAQIQISINKALDQFQFSDNENQWSSAKDRITSMQSEANARAEVASTSMDSKLREMEFSQMDAQAEDELAQLEAKMAMGGSPASRYTNTTTVQQVQTLGGNGATAGGSANGTSGGGTGPAVESDLDKQLRELEEKLGKR